MEGRLHSRRHDVKQRRKTLRQSVLEERRQTGLLTNESTPETDENSGHRLLTRAAIRAVDAKCEAARQLRERKARKALTAKEVQKARPPFNNYIRVKHTGLSPFRRFQDASKRSRVAPWRAPLPKAQAPVAASSKSNAAGHKKKAEAAGKSKQALTTSHLPVPSNKVAAGVMQFGMMSHDSAKTAFKPPAKIQPIPFATRSTRTQATRMEPGKEKLRIIPKNIPANRVSPKARFVKKLVVPTVLGKQPLPVVVQLPIQPSKTTHVATIKPRGMKKQLTEMVRNMEVRPLPKRASRQNVEPSSRILRSSQFSSQPDYKDNLQPNVSTKVLAKVSKRVTKNAAGTSDRQVPVVASPHQTPIEERTKGLEERSAQLARETDRMRSLADEWTSLKLTPSLPASVADEIDSVTGQTILLTSKKFAQYKGLIEGAYTNTRTTLEDLDGFWEMVYIQVRQLDARYKDLNAMKEKNWNTKSPKLFKNVVTREKKRSKPAKKLSIGKSNFQKFLAEKLKKGAESSGGTPSKPMTDDKLENQFIQVLESPLLNMSVDGEFETPVRSFNVTQRSGTPRSTPRTLENVLRASRSIRYSNTMMRLSSIFQDTSTS